MKKLVLVIPCYNPIDNWEQNLLDSYNEFCNNIGYGCNVVLVNDGCKNDISKQVDVLKSVLKEKLIYVIHDINKGKGAALKTGVAQSESDIYMFTDIDFPYTTKSMVAIFNEANNKNGIVSGYRKSEYYEHLSRARTFISKALRFFNTYILALPTNDTQCGLKAFDNDVKKLFVACQTDRFLLDLELLLSVNAHKLEIHPVHVSLNEGVTFTKFNYIVLFQELGNFIKLIIKYRIYYRFIK